MRLLSYFHSESANLFSEQRTYSSQRKPKRNQLRYYLLFLLAIFLVNPVSAQFDETIDLTIKKAKEKLDQLSKDGLSASEVEEITETLQDIASDNIEGTGVGEMLDLMNTHAGNIAKGADAKGKLDSTIDLVEKLSKATEPDANGNMDGEAVMEALAAGTKLAGELAGEVPVIGMVIGPMMDAYAQAIQNGATQIGAIQAARDRVNEIIRQTKIGANVAEGEEGDYYEYQPINNYPYPRCPECELAWWMAGNAKARWDRATVESDKAQAELDRRYADKRAGQTKFLMSSTKELDEKSSKADKAFFKAKEHYEALQKNFEACLEDCIKVSEDEYNSKIGTADEVFNKAVKIYQFFFTIFAAQTSSLNTVRGTTVLKPANYGPEKPLTESPDKIDMFGIKLELSKDTVINDRWVRLSGEFSAAGGSRTISESTTGTDLAFASLSSHTDPTDRPSFVYLGKDSNGFNGFIYPAFIGMESSVKTEIDEKTLKFKAIFGKDPDKERDNGLWQFNPETSVGYTNRSITHTSRDQSILIPDIKAEMDLDVDEDVFFASAGGTVSRAIPGMKKRTVIEIWGDFKLGRSNADLDSQQTITDPVVGNFLNFNVDDSEDRTITEGDIEVRIIRQVGLVGAVKAFVGFSYSDIANVKLATPDEVQANVKPTEIEGDTVRGWRLGLTYVKPF